eukprot:2413717-Pleurochrysis_carterae.AAC.2
MTESRCRVEKKAWARQSQSQGVVEKQRGRATNVEAGLSRARKKVEDSEQCRQPNADTRSGQK